MATQKAAANEPLPKTTLKARVRQLLQHVRADSKQGTAELQALINALDTTIRRWSDIDALSAAEHSLLDATCRDVKRPGPLGEISAEKLARGLAVLASNKSFCDFCRTAAQQKSHDLLALGVFLGITDIETASANTTSVSKIDCDPKFGHTHDEDMPKLEIRPLEDALRAFALGIRNDETAARVSLETCPEEWNTIRQLLLIADASLSTLPGETVIETSGQETVHDGKSLPAAMLESQLTEASFPAVPTAHATKSAKTKASTQRPRNAAELQEAEQTRKDFAERLRKARKAAKLTTAQLAEAAGMQQPAISRYEAGRRLPLGYQIKRLAAALRVAPSELLPNSWKNRPEEG